VLAILTILTAAAALTGVLLVLFRPHWAFLLVVAMYVLEQVLQSYFQFFVNHGSAFQFIVGGLVGFAIVMRSMRREPIASGYNNAGTWLMLGQFGLWLVGMLYSMAPDAAMENLKEAWPYLTLYIILLPFLIIDLEDFSRFLTGLMIVGSIIALLILFNPLSSYHYGRLVLDLGMRGANRDSYGNPLAVAELGGMLSLVAALVKPRFQTYLFSLLRVAAFVLGLGLAIGSGSRGQVLAMLVACVMFFPAARRVRDFKAFFFAAFLGAILSIGAYATFTLFIGEQNRVRWSIPLMIEDIGLRFDMAWQLIAAWLASPTSWFMGLGTNSWVAVGGESTVQGAYVHNIAAEILGEQGLLGATVFTLAILVTIRAGYRLWRIYAHDPSMRATATLAVALGAYSLFQALKQGTITSGQPFFWWLVLTKISRHEQVMHAEQTEAIESLDEEHGFPEGLQTAYAR
jgi:hypothetical protein